jgi:hypothetical protein
MNSHKLTLSALIASALFASSAHAHINAYLGDATGRNGDMKALPCDGDRGDGPVYTYEPGATIDIKVDEFVPHPSYFRIAFDVDGQDFIEPRSISPIEKGRACKYNSYDQCMGADFCNDETVLLDNLEPHPTIFPGKTYNWTIKLPDVECENCTLQIIQVMEDTIHGAYCPWDMASCKGEPNAVQDIYHRCFDLKLQKGAENGPGASSKSVSLPADKQYIDCSKQMPDDATHADDAGTPPGQSSSDAGRVPVDSVDHDAGTSSGEIGSQHDSSVKDPAVKRDAGTKKDAGTASSDEDGDSEPAAAKDDSGCALATSSEGAAWGSLGFGLLLFARRRRAFRRFAHGCFGSR